MTPKKPDPLVGLSTGVLAAVADNGKLMIERRLTGYVLVLRDAAAALEVLRDTGDYLHAIHRVTWDVAGLSLDKLAAEVADLRAVEAVLADRRTR